MSNNWVVQSLQNALDFWNGRLNEIWALLRSTPKEISQGVESPIWTVMVNINNAIQAIAFGLLVLFFMVSLVKTCGSFTDLKKPEHVLKLFVRFALAKAAVTYGMDLLLMLFQIIQGVTGTIMDSAGLGSPGQITLPDSLVTTIENCGFWESIPLWIVALIGNLLIWVLSFIVILTVYGRFFKLYMYTALAPVPLSTFAGETTQNIGKSFIKSYAGVCLEGAVIVLACIIFSLFSTAFSPQFGNPTSPASAVWTYLAEQAFNMLVLVGTVKMSDRIVKEMMGL